MAPKKCKHGETRGKTNQIKSKLACILEACEYTRLRMEDSLPSHHEDHIAGKGDNSLQHYNLVPKFIPMPPAMKKKVSGPSNPPGELAQNVSKKKNPARTNYSFIFLRKFRI